MFVHALVLREYSKFVKHHDGSLNKYIMVSHYNKANVMDSSIAEHDVPLTIEVKAQVMHEFTTTLRCLKHSEI